MMMPRRRLSKEPDYMFKIKAKLAPMNDPNVDPKLVIDINREIRFLQFQVGTAARIRSGTA